MMTSIRRGVVLGAVCVGVISAAAGCGRGPSSGHGFTLPEGDVAAGEAAYVKFQCADCHAIADREDLRTIADPAMTVPIGGLTTRVSTYGELVTSVINPSHRISQRYLGDFVQTDGVSAMRNNNDAMTVTELADLVTFLQDQYELDPYPNTAYPSLPY